MAATRRITRNVQMGLSHSEKAKRLSYKGFYGDALEELSIALRAFEAENRDGVWDEAIAGVLNNIGFTRIFLGDYHKAEEAFISALAIKERLRDVRSMAGTLAGLSDAYRGQCRFGDALDSLERAYGIALELRDCALAGAIMERMDALERARCDMPAIDFREACFDELYVPWYAADVLLQVERLDIRVMPPNTIKVDADLGFPFLMKGLSRPGHNGPFPAMSILFPKGILSPDILFEVADEEETPAVSKASRFDGIVFGPCSYHRAGPLPVPSCKEYIYTHGTGFILSWEICANGWYHLSAAIDASGLERLRLYIGFPFGEARLGEISAMLAEPGAWRMERLSCGRFIHSRTLDLSGPPLSQDMSLYEGPPAGEIARKADVFLKFGILCLSLEK